MESARHSNQPSAIESSARDAWSHSQHQLVYFSNLSAKFQLLLTALQQKFTGGAVCVCQVWLAFNCDAQRGDVNDISLYAEPALAIGDNAFLDFRQRSCQAPVQYRNSMPGKVWKSGAVQIVQNLKIIPPSLHPRSQLSDALLERVSEALYIPVYDLALSGRGPVSVMEVLLSSSSTEAMLMADFLSCVSTLLSALNLSLANPVPQPIRKSALCGRRARATESSDDDDDDEKTGPRTSAQGDQATTTSAVAAQLAVAGNTATVAERPSVFGGDGHLPGVSHATDSNSSTPQRQGRHSASGVSEQQQQPHVQEHQQLQPQQQQSQQRHEPTPASEFLRAHSGDCGPDNVLSSSLKSDVTQAVGGDVGGKHEVPMLSVAGLRTTTAAASEAGSPMAVQLCHTAASSSHSHSQSCNMTPFEQQQQQHHHHQQLHQDNLHQHQEPAHSTQQNALRQGPPWSNVGGSRLAHSSADQQQQQQWQLQQFQVLLQQQLQHGTISQQHQQLQQQQHGDSVQQYRQWQIQQLIIQQMQSQQQQQQQLQQQQQQLLQQQEANGRVRDCVLGFPANPDPIIAAPASTEDEIEHPSGAVAPPRKVRRMEGGMQRSKSMHSVNLN